MTDEIKDRIQKTESKMREADPNTPLFQYLFGLRADLKKKLRGVVTLHMAEESLCESCE